VTSSIKRTPEQGRSVVVAVNAKGTVWGGRWENKCTMGEKEDLPDSAHALELTAYKGMAASSRLFGRSM